MLPSESNKLLRDAITNADNIEVNVQSTDRGRNTYTMFIANISGYAFKVDFVYNGAVTSVLNRTLIDEQTGKTVLSFPTAKAYMILCPRDFREFADRELLKKLPELSSHEEYTF